MKIRFLSIASEVLSGSVVNTNAAFISKKLELTGYKISSHQVCLDDKAAIKKVLLESIDEFNLTIVTGGLGPTVDDLTKVCAVEAFHLTLEKSLELEKDLEKRFKGLSSIDQESRVPKGCTLLLNSVGTATGFIVEKNHHFIAFMPGVPQEARAMLDDQLLPWLEKNLKPEVRFHKNYLVAHKKESELNPFLEALSHQFLDLECGIYPNYGYLQLTFSAQESKVLAQVEKKVEALLSTFLIHHGPTIEEALINILKEKGLTISLAESCTGGHISALLTKIDGVSSVFEGAVVCYSNASKEALLEVDRQVLERHGAVSLECAKALSAGCLKKFHTTCAISVTGIAGPSGGSLDQPVGTVFASIAAFGDIVSGALPLRHRMKREVNIQFSANYLLAALYRYLNYQVIPFSDET